MARSQSHQSQRRRAEIRPKKPVGIKLVFDYRQDTAVVHMLPNALDLGFNLLDMLPDMVCYTPALEHPGVFTDTEMMDVADVGRPQGSVVPLPTTTTG